MCDGGFEAAANHSLGFVIEVNLKVRARPEGR